MKAPIANLLWIRINQTLGLWVIIAGLWGCDLVPDPQSTRTPGSNELPANPDPSTTPDGKAACDQVAHGAQETRIYYKEAEVSFGTTCESETQTRTCEDGTFGEWSGSFTAAECEIAAPANCTGTNGPIAHEAEETRSAYASATVPYGQTCQVEIQKRTCSNGTLSAWSGSYTHLSCTVQNPATCSGSSSRTRYKNATEPFGTACQSEQQTRTCNNGTWSSWSGSFTQTSCSVNAPASCDGVAHQGQQTRTRFETASVPYAKTCRNETQTRTCDNGNWLNWTGSFTFASCAVDPKPNPQYINFPGIALRGLSDPMITKGEGSRLWMVFTSINNSVLWGATNGISTSLHLAYSDDQGANWTYAQKMVDFIDVTTRHEPGKPAGTWVNEVATLTYHPQTAASKRWKLVWHKYLHHNGASLHALGWLSAKEAASPLELKDAPEIKLMSGDAYDIFASYLLTTGGLFGNPLAGSPKIALDKIDPSLAGCNFSEPSLLSRTDGIYFAALCAKADGIQRLELFKYDHSGAFDNPSTWKHVKRLISDSEAAALGSPLGFSAPNLFVKNGSVYLMASPVSANPYPPVSYNGLWIFKFENLSQGKLIKIAGVPKTIYKFNSAENRFNGNGTYHEYATKSGLLYVDSINTDTVIFKIYQTKFDPIP